LRAPERPIGLLYLFLGSNTVVLYAIDAQAVPVLPVQTVHTITALHGIHMLMFVALDRNVTRTQLLPNDIANILVLLWMGSLGPHGPGMLLAPWRSLRSVNVQLGTCLTYQHEAQIHICSGST
jgi:hypothetical protein